MKKKNQNVSGSVCEKIQTGPFKLWQYKKIFEDYEIKYIYCLSKWFYDNCPSELKYLEENKINYFIANDKYKDSIVNFITQKN